MTPSPQEEGMPLPSRSNDAIPYAASPSTPYTYYQQEHSYQNPTGECGGLEESIYEKEFDFDDYDNDEDGGMMSQGQWAHNPSLNDNLF
jgi:hypothetical protein